MSNTYQPVLISHQAALQIVTNVIAEGSRRGLRLVATVVDPSLQVVAFCRADGANPLNAGSSRRAAKTACADDRPSGWMSDHDAIVLALAAGNEETNMRGGLPIRFDGVVVGGLGVGGAAPDDNVAVARAALSSVDADDPMSVA
ncbi:heme-binding protein [Streptomyces prunicolor]|uniref:heme-binding protein n=1 Tax=Streptomyces prunicolor TaxID=67348 RepID=UPI00386C9CE4|nr:heme-binding protein [Streptomyces prunicolor]